MEHNVPSVPHVSGAHGAHLPRGMCLMCSNAVCLLGFVVIGPRPSPARRLSPRNELRTL
jgi:hypothetical protein